MGKVTLSPTNSPEINKESVVELSVESVLQEPVFDPKEFEKILKLQECQNTQQLIIENLEQTTFKQNELIKNLNEKIDKLSKSIKEIKCERKNVSVYERYDDKDLRSLIQGVMVVMEKNQEGQEFVNSRFRADISGLKNETHPVSQIIRIHERLPNWVRYMLIFNLIIALLGFLT